MQLSYIYPKMFRESEGGLNEGFFNWFLIDLLLGGALTRRIPSIGRQASLLCDRVSFFKFAIFFY